MAWVITGLSLETVSSALSSMSKGALNDPWAFAIGILLVVPMISVGRIRRASPAPELAQTEEHLMLVARLHAQTPPAAPLETRNDYGEAA